MAAWPFFNPLGYKAPRLLQITNAELWPACMNWNVYITLLQRVGDSFAQGIWCFVALPTYVWLIENHSNKARFPSLQVPYEATPSCDWRSSAHTLIWHQAVGYTQGIQGFAMAAVAVPGKPSKASLKRQPSCLLTVVCLP